MPEAAVAKAHQQTVLKHQETVPSVAVEEGAVAQHLAQGGMVRVGDVGRIAEGLGRL